MIRIPYFEYLLYIFYPIKYVLIGLAYIKLDLNSVRVTCDGSQAPIKMCFNIAIIGTIIVLVESSYSLTFLVTLKKLYQHLFDVYFFTPGFRSWSKLGICDFFSFTIYLTIFAFICSSVPFQGILQFLMTFVQIQAFIGGHAHNASCDRVEGLYGLDSTLAYWTTIVFYSMIIPSVYSIGRILVPGLPSGKRVFRFLGRNGYIVQKDLYTNYTVAIYDIPEAKKSLSETSLIYKYFDAIKSRTNVIVSPDVWFLSTIGLLNLRFLKYKVAKILYIHYVDDDIHEADFPADDKLNILDVCNMNLKISEAEQLKSMQNTDFPTYMLISSFVHQEFQRALGVKERVYERIYFGQTNKVIDFILLILAYSVSLGIWTEEAVEAFSLELQHARLTLYYHKDVGDSLYAILGLRSVLFQIVPILTILSIFVQNTAKSPLFVFTRTLSSRLPSLFTSMINAKLLALEAELDRLKDLRIDAATNADILDIQEWLISFRAVFIICTTSRLVTFTVHMFVVCMSVGVCYSLQHLKLWIMASIIIIAPIAITTSIATITSIGTMMHITDKHFNDFNFNFTSKNLLPLAVHYDKKTAKKHDDLGIDIDYYGLFNDKNYKPDDPDEYSELEDHHERPSRAIEYFWLSGPVQCEDRPERPSRRLNHGHLFQISIDNDTEANSDSSHFNDAIDNPIDAKIVQRSITKTSSSRKIVSNILKLFSSDNNASILISDDPIKASNSQDEDDGDDDDDIEMQLGAAKRSGKRVVSKLLDGDIDLDADGDDSDDNDDNDSIHADVYDVKLVTDDNNHIHTTTVDTQAGDIKHGMESDGVGEASDTLMTAQSDSNNDTSDIVTDNNDRAVRSILEKLGIIIVSDFSDEDKTVVSCSDADNSNNATSDTVHVTDDDAVDDDEVVRSILSKLGIIVIVTCDSTDGVESGGDDVGDSTTRISTINVVSDTDDPIEEVYSVDGTNDNSTDTDTIITILNSIIDTIIDTYETGSSGSTTDTIIDTYETGSSASTTDIIIDTYETGSSASITDTSDVGCDSNTTASIIGITSTISSTSTSYCIKRSI